MMPLFSRAAFAPQPLARRLALRFEAAPLAEALAAVPEAAWQRHAGPFHDGAWEAVALWAPRGDPREQTSRGGAFAATPLLARLPAVQHVLEALPAERNRVRLMRLRPGGRILRHSDPLHTIDPRLVRLHVPLATNPDVHFRVNDRRVIMREGETWHVDVRFPHEVENRGDTVRVHLVIDLVRDTALDAMLAGADTIGTGWLAGYFLRHSLPAPVRRAFRVGN
ncbi:MAG: aspartyl/asparaginyl beta-hydroxylase domain-containing protein [Gemmatimonadetes bacterium]|nr:aspartyl/asparaginyl beta-hydroxylase domain-containing protein [Gemmatimonadota bacterium]